MKSILFNSHSDLKHLILYSEIVPHNIKHFKLCVKYKYKFFFEVSVTQITADKFIGSVKPDYVFQGEFDKDDDKSFSDLCDLEYKVENLIKSFKSLNCQVVAVRKEISSINMD